MGLVALLFLPWPVVTSASSVTHFPTHGSPAGIAPAVSAAFGPSMPGSAASVPGGSAGNSASPRPFAGPVVYPAWNNISKAITPGPTSRYLGMTAYDPIDQYVVLFGGSGSSGITADTWTYGNGQWVQLAPLTSPPARYAGMMCWDSSDGYVLLFGGYNAAGTYFNDTWTFLHGTWTNLTGTTVKTPQGRWRAGFADDPADAKVVLFGGTNSAGTPLADTWLYHGGTWTDVTSNVTGGPPARYRTQMAYDPLDGYDVLFGGCTSTSSPCATSDTWTYVGLKWTKLGNSSYVHPAARVYSPLVWDPLHGYIVLFGGTYSTAGPTTVYKDTWIFSAGNWTNITANVTGHPAQRAYYMSAFDALDGYLLLFGGQDTNTLRYYGDTWAFGPAVLGQLHISPSPVDSGQLVQVNSTPLAFVGWVNYSYTGLPLGCASQNLSLFNCTPTQVGTFSVTAWLNDSNGQNFTYTASLVVGLPPRINSFIASPPTITATVTTHLVVNVTAGAPPISYGFAGLPPGCASANLANLTCTPSARAAGPYLVNVTVTDGAGARRNALLTLTVNAVPRLTLAAAPSTVDVNQSVTFYANATLGTAPFTYTYYNLPSGCHTADTSRLTCVPNQVTSITVEAAVSDAFGVTAFNNSSLTVDMALSALITLAPSVVDVGTPFTIWVNISGGTGTPTVTYSSLPGGCAVGHTDPATCTPQASGPFSIGILVTDSVGGRLTSTLPLRVNAAPTVQSLNVLPAAIDVGQPVNVSVNVSGGTAPFAYAWGQLPAGCTAPNAPYLICTPRQTTTTSVLVTVTDHFGLTTQSSARLVVNALPTISSFTASVSPVAPGSSTVLSVTATGGTGGFSYSYSGLPTGCASQNASSLTCIPAATGTFTVSVTVTDAVGKSATSQATVTVAKPSGSSSSLLSGGTTIYILLAVLLIVAIAAAVLVLRRGPPPARTPPAREPAPEYAETPEDAPPESG